MGTTNANFGFGFGRYGTGRYGNEPVENLPLGYYLSILTSEYQNSTKFVSWLTSALRKLDDINFCLVTFITSFDLLQAVGPQLDIIGTLIGQARTVAFQPTGGVSPTLDDATYRVLLQARVAQNTWNGTIGGLQTIWQSLFPGGRIVLNDNQNMTVTVLLTGAFTTILQDLINNGYIVPRPEGVLYTFTYPVLPALGFDEQNGFISGLDSGNWT